MPTTSFGPTIAAGTPYGPLDTLPAISSDWEVKRTWVQERAAVDTWWAALSVTASVDPGIEGAVRLVANEGPVISTEARIVAHVGPILIGWIQLTWPAEAIQTISVEARRSAGTGGGVKLHRAELTLMTSPPAAQQGGPTYPPGYDPGQQAPYPDSYETAEPYGG